MLTVRVGVFKYGHLQLGTLSRLTRKVSRVMDGADVFLVTCLRFTLDACRLVRLCTLDCLPKSEYFEMVNHG